MISRLSSFSNRWMIVLFLILISGITSVFSQPSGLRPGPSTEQQRFIYKTFAMPTMAPDSVVIFLYAKVSYDMLQFTLSDSIYHAQYQLTVLIRDAEDEAIASNIHNKTITTREYDETNNKLSFDKIQLEFPVSPGEYKFFIELTDAETDIPISHEKSLSVPHFFNDRFKATDILFFHESAGDEPKQPTFPEIPAVHALSDSNFSAEMFICNDGTLDSIRIIQTILSKENEPVFEKVTVDVPLRGRKQPVKFNLDKNYRFGQYLLSIQITDGQRTEEVKHPFYIRWKDHTTLLPSLTQTVETLQYIMSTGEWKDLKALSMEEQEKAIERFWAERDPDLSTEINELEEEYYTRVAFANHNFSTWQGGMEGWKTDRGRIYILFGPPTDIERPITTAGNRLYYEIWYYSHLQRRFVFRDRYGVGEYRLISEEY